MGPSNVCRWLLLSTIILLTGCAASGSIQPQSAGSISIDDSSNAAVEVTHTATNGAASAQALAKELNAKLVENRVFASIVPTVGSGADILVRGDVKQVVEVTQGARILFGALAGQAKLVVDVKVIDARNAVELGTLTATGTSSGGHVFAGTTSEAVQQVADQVVSYLLRNRRVGAAPSRTSPVDTASRLAELKQAYIAGRIDEATYLERRRLLTDVQLSGEIRALRAERVRKARSQPSAANGVAARDPTTGPFRIVVGPYGNGTSWDSLGVLDIPIDGRMESEISDAATFELLYSRHWNTQQVAQQPGLSPKRANALLDRIWTGSELTLTLHEDRAHAASKALEADGVMTLRVRDIGAGWYDSRYEAEVLLFDSLRNDMYSASASDAELETAVRSVLQQFRQRRAQP